MTEKHRVARVNDIPPGTMKGVLAGRTPVLLANVEGEMHAMANLCTHVKVPLSVGKIEDGVVTCWLHGSTFDVRTGGVVEWLPGKFPPGYDRLIRLRKQKGAATYPATVEDGDILVEV